MFKIKSKKVNSQNTLILGMTGAGKSTLQKEKIKKCCTSKRYRGQIIVIDSFGEYRELAEQYAGEIILPQVLQKQVSFQNSQKKDCHERHNLNNSETNENKILVYDLSRVPETLKGAAFEKCLTVIEEKIHRNNRCNIETRVFLEDLHIIISYSAELAYKMAALWENSKSCNSVFSAVCGDDESLYTDPGQAILNNTQHFLIFKCPSVKYPRNQKLYFLSDKQLKKLKLIDKGKYIHVNCLVVVPLIGSSTKLEIMYM